MLKLNKAPFVMKSLNKVYEFYDEPIVYTFIDEAGRLFLTIWVDWDEEKYTWLTKQITFQIAKNLENKTLTLRETILDPLIPTVIIIEEFNDNSRNYYISSVDDLEKRFIPDHDSFIEYESESNNYFLEKIENATDISNRYIVDLSLEPNNTHEYEIGANVLGGTLVNFQRLVEAVALGDEATNRSRISDEVRDENELLVTGTFAASFGVRLESSKLASLIQEDEIKKSINKVINLLATGNDFASRSGSLSEYNLKALNSLRNLLSGLIEKNVGMKVKSAYPTVTDVVQTKEVHLSSNESLTLLNNIENTKTISSENVNVEGTLYSFDSNSRSFKLITEDSIIYRGYVSENSKNNSFNIPSNGTANLNLIKTNFIYTGEVKEAYELLSWTSHLD